MDLKLIVRMITAAFAPLAFDKGSSPPAAPPVPDPALQIAAEAKANRYNVRSPFGSQTWYAPGQAPSLPSAPNAPAAPAQSQPFTLNDFLDYNKRAAPAGYTDYAKDADIQYQNYRNQAYGDDAAVARQFGFAAPAGAAPVAAPTYAPAQSNAADPFSRYDGFNPQTSPAPAQTYAPTPSPTSGRVDDYEPWTQEIQLDPSQQRQQDSKNAIAEAMLGRARTQFDQFQSTPFSYGASDPNVRARSDAINTYSAPSSRSQYGEFNPSWNMGQFNPNVRDLGAFNPSQLTGEFNPNVRDLGAFNPDAGASRGEFNPNVQNIGAYNPTRWNMGQFNPSTQEPGSFKPQSWDLGSFNSGVTEQAQFNPSAWNLGDFNASTADPQSRELVRRLSSLSDAPWSSGVDGSAVRDAMFQKQKLLLDPHYDREEGRLEQSLANKGIPMGAEAFKSDYGDFGRARDLSYERAALDAVIAGAGEEQNQFGRALSTRQQGVNEIAAALSGSQAQTGQEFGREIAARGQRVGEQAQQYGQGLTTRQQQQADLDAQYRRSLATRGQQVGEQGQQYSQGLSTQQQLQADAQARYARELATRGQQVGEQGQQFNQGQAVRQQMTAEQQADFARQAQTRQIQSGDIADIFQRTLASRGQQTAEQQADYARQLGTRGQQVAEQAQRYGQDTGTRRLLADELQADYARQLATRGQQVGEQGQQYSQGLTTRQQQVGEMSDDYTRWLAGQQAGQQSAMTADQFEQQRQLTQRQQQYNELAALLGGQQLTPLNPSGGQLDVGGAFANQQAGVNRQYQGQVAGYNAGVAGNNSTMGGLFSLGAAALPLAFSDIRLKRDIERKGTLMPGVDIYEFQYVWGGARQLGVMAQEVAQVMPEAVIERSDGYLMVDYSRLLAGRTLH